MAPHVFPLTETEWEADPDELSGGFQFSPIPWSKTKVNSRTGSRSSSLTRFVMEYGMRKRMPGQFQVLSLNVQHSEKSTPENVKLETT